jgi:hypothetical protein
MMIEGYEVDEGGQLTDTRSPTHLLSSARIIKAHESPDGNSVVLPASYEPASPFHFLCFIHLIFIIILFIL